MLNWIKLWWNREKIAKDNLKRAFAQAELEGCRDSAETLVLNCRQIWERFGWWSYEASAAVVWLHCHMAAIIGDNDRAAMVALGAASYAVRIGQNPKDFLVNVSSALAGTCRKGKLDQSITNADKVRLVELFPSIIRDLRMRDEGLPTAERVLIWIARTDEHGTW